MVHDEPPETQTQRSRLAVNLIVGIPAALAGLGLALLLGIGSLARWQRLPEHYETLDQEADGKDAQRIAYIARGRLLELAPLDRDRVVALAHAAYEVDQDDHADELLTSLGPSVELSDPLAAVFRLRQQREAADGDPDVLATLSERLEEVLDSNPGFVPVHRELATLAWLRRDYAAAAHHLQRCFDLAQERPFEEVRRLALMTLALGDANTAYETIADAKVSREALLEAHPELRTVHAAWLALTGRAGRAHDAAATSRDACNQLVAADPDDPLARVIASIAARLAGDFRTGVRLLEPVAQHDLARGQLLGAYLAWHQARADERTDQEPDRNLLEAAYELDPSSTPVFLLALRDAARHGSSPLVERMIERDDVSPELHTLLGGHAAQRADWDRARRHLEAALRENPDLAEARNNLAWVLAHQDEPDLQTALRLVDEALRQQPKRVTFHHTRAVVLVALERYQAALPELLLCEEVNPNDAELHRLLATVYEALELPELAERHAARANGP